MLKYLSEKGGILMLFTQQFQGSITEARHYWEDILENNKKIKFSGLRFANRLPFNSEEDAYNYINSMSSKNGYAIGVEFYISRSLNKREESKINSFERKIQSAQERYKTRKNSLDSRFFMSKSQFVTCKKCKSRLNKRSMESYVKEAKCPVCGNILISDAGQKSLKKYVDKVVELTKEFQVIFKEVQKGCLTRDKMWLIGGKI